MAFPAPRSARAAFAAAAAVLGLALAAASVEQQPAAAAVGAAASNETGATEAKAAATEAKTATIEAQTATIEAQAAEAGAAANDAKVEAPAPAADAQAPAPAAAAQAPAETPAVQSYVLAGDLQQIAKKGTLRFLVRSAPEFLPRQGDPRLAEEELARAFAARLALTPVFVPRSSLEEMVADLKAGRGDVIAASLEPTKARAAQMAFSRPIRHVAQVVATRAGDETLKTAEDLAGREVTVRASSSYAAALEELGRKVKGIRVRPAPESEDTVSLLLKVARGEAAATVADSDIFASVLAFEPGLRAAFPLVDKSPIAWALRRDSTALKSALDSFLVEKALSEHKDHVYKADLDEIRRRGVLRVLTRNASTTYFLYKGEQLGFEYELAREFARDLGVRLEITIPPSREALLEWLKEGRGDLVAAGLAVTPEREKEVAFSEAYNTVSELLVVRAKDPAKTLADLEGRPVAVRPSSSYRETLEKLRERHGWTIEPLPEDVETEEALQLVGEGKLGATVADSNIVDLELTWTDGIRSVGPLGDPRRIAWALRPDQPALRKAADAFVKKHKGSLFFNMTVNKYFKNGKMMRAASGEARADREGRLSPYDALVKRYARQFEFDWRLITSQMYQESHFDPAAKSWVGALGLMQVMPATARELHIDNLPEPENGIHAGVKVLARYSQMFKAPGVKEKDRIRFALAAYNCGPGHVHDARALASAMKLNPNKWFGNVEKAMLLLSKPEYARRARHGYCRCEEPVKYVSEIQSRYDGYSRVARLE